MVQSLIKGPWHELVLVAGSECYFASMIALSWGCPDWPWRLQSEAKLRWKFSYSQTDPDLVLLSVS